MPHLLFHLSADGHMDCLYILAIVNSAAMNMECMYLFELLFLFSSSIYPVLELLDHMAVLFLVF